ncbi:hypothetical protein RRG08_056883 [Elysia crispata]|uniref:Uncharacterized protein n=1 Tax=Elysia crispata TaxID=231223 RepID=A0AAE1DEC7_9GAST|nr:hypothetical protein RRG08_056883 [Elysia crispata]
MPFPFTQVLHTRLVSNHSLVMMRLRSGSRAILSVKAELSAKLVIPTFVTERRATTDDDPESVEFYARPNTCITRGSRAPDQFSTPEHNGQDGGL